MTRAELIAYLSNQHRELSPKVVDESVREIFELMIDTLSKGERIEIRGFGSFEIRERLPRTAHNPKSGTKVQLSHRRAVHFKPGVELKERVNNK